VRYDAVYNPWEWYHIEIQWLVCTATVLDDWLSTLERESRSLGLKWLPVPVTFDRSKVLFWLYF